MAQAAITKYESLLFEGAKVLELGSGNSTAWLINHGAEVISYEHSETWYAQMKGAFKEISHGEIRLFPHYYEEIARLESSSFDICIVDGIDRGLCVKAIIENNLLKPDGILIFDDSERRWFASEYTEACELIEQTYSQIEYIGDYPIHTHEEYKEHKSRISPHRLKQSLFATNF
jgi:predicted O-methyltransferase YrrM